MDEKTTTEKQLSSRYNSPILWIGIKKTAKGDCLGRSDDGNSAKITYKIDKKYPNFERIALGNLSSRYATM